MITVFVQIGNSGDKLPQSEWSAFVAAVDNHIQHFAWRVHGAFYAAPDSCFQNACFCFEIVPTGVQELKKRFRLLRDRYRQDSIAWSVVATTEFI